MSEAPVPQQIPLPTFIKRSDNQFRWSLGITVAALLIQVAFFSAVAAYNLSLIDWGGDPAVVLASPETAIIFEQAIVLLPFAGLGLVCVFACLLRPQLGWHMAMLVQSGILLIALQVYLSDRNNILTRRPLLYLYMLGAILIIVFMNSPEGRLLLGQRRRKHHG
ncbi:MAG TPA: hypothetical protein P5333_15425 [Caldilinea sp.]|nr:hypothetical protein [Caldilinea sp.]